MTDLLVQPEAQPMPLAAWLEKAGTAPEAASQVRAAFAEASPAARTAFRIQSLAEDDFSFVWQRLVARAVKP